MKKIKWVKRIALTLLITVVTFIFTFAIGVKVRAATITVHGVDLIYTNPGEDCSTQITISWHASKYISELTYTEATDTSYKNAQTLTVTGTFDKTSFIYYDVAEFYKCSVTLNDLLPAKNFKTRI